MLLKKFLSQIVSGLKANTNLVFIFLNPKLFPPPNPKFLPVHSIVKFEYLLINSFSFSKFSEFSIILTLTFSSKDFKQLDKISLLVL